MRILFTLLLGSLLVGQLGGIPLKEGVVVYFHDIVTCVLVGLVVFRYRKQGMQRSPVLGIPILVFAAIGVLSLVVNIPRYTPAQLGEASLYLIRWVLYAGIYVASLHKQINSQFLKRGLFFTGTGVAALGLIQYALYPGLQNLWYLGWDPHYYRLFSTFLDPNFVGIVIALTMFIGLAERKLFVGRVFWVSQMINGLALYLTYSRSTYLAFAAGVVAWIIVKKEWRLLWGLVLFAFVIALPKPGGDTLKLTRVNSTLSRLENWQASIARFSEAPLLGHGFNTLRFRPIFTQPPILAGVVSRAAAGVDSSVLFLLITTGVLGTAVYGWLLIRMGRLSWGFSILIIVLLVHSLFTNSLVYPWVLVILWMYAGAVEKKATSGTSRSAR